MPFRVPNVGTVGITLLFKFRIAVRIRTVSGGNDFGFFGRWTFGTDNEQDTSQATASFCLSMLFEELFRKISFFHRFLAPERHSCQKVGVNVLIRQLLLRLLLSSFPVFDRRVHVPWKSGLSKMQKVEQ